jgi:hypothetical protein
VSGRLLPPHERHIPETVDTFTPLCNIGLTPPFAL